jgi:hypothetical protein
MLSTFLFRRLLAGAPHFRIGSRNVSAERFLGLVSGEQTPNQQPETEPATSAGRVTDRAESTKRR